MLKINQVYKISIFLYNTSKVFLNTWLNILHSVTYKAMEWTLENWIWQDSFILLTLMWTKEPPPDLNCNDFVTIIRPWKKTGNSCPKLDTEILCKLLTQYDFCQIFWPISTSSEIMFTSKVYDEIHVPGLFLQPTVKTMITHRCLFNFNLNLWCLTFLQF